MFLRERGMYFIICPCNTLSNNFHTIQIDEKSVKRNNLVDTSNVNFLSYHNLPCVFLFFTILTSLHFSLIHLNTFLCKNMSNIGNINDKAKFIRAVEEAFFILDRDKNRTIGSDDFCVIAKSIGIDLDSNEALLLLRTALDEQTDDPIHDTTLTIDQYSTLMLRHVGSSELNDELRQTFDALDRDHDGEISRQDMDRLRHENDFFDKLDDEQYELIINELLILGNNGINFDQFVQLMMQ